MEKNIRIKRRRIYYLPGILSLIMLPIMVCFYVNKKQLLQEKTFIEINTYNPIEAKRLPESYPKNFPPKREYTEINLAGNDNEDKIKIDFARLEIRSLASTFDTIRGIRIYFTDNTKYWTLISALDICKNEKCQTYTFYNNQLFVFNKTLVEESNPGREIFKSFCGTSIGNCLPKIISEPSISLKERIKLIFLQLKNYYLSVVLFLLLIVFTLKKILKP